ncbi:unnamed protein product, partial [Symbiodinium necroappetens]
PCWTEATRTYQVLGKWPEALWKQRKVTSEQYEKYLYLSRDGVLARKRNLDAVKEQEASLAEAALIEATTRRVRANAALYRPFPPVAAAQAWLALFLQDRLRYPLLVVRGASHTGKTEWVKSLFKNALELKVGSLQVFPEAMRGFERDTHDGIILDDVRDMAFLADHQDKLQGKYDSRVEFATTPGGTCAFRKYLFAIPIAVTVNYSTANLHYLDSHDWLGHEGNRVLVNFPEVLSDGAVQLAAVVASIMPLVSDVRHPQSLDFANERKTLLLRDVHGLSWAAIQKQVVNLRGETPSVRLLQRLHQDVNRDLGRRVYKYSNCGRKATKATAAVQKYLVGRLLVLRKRTTCTAATLRRELVANKGVDLDESTIRKILRDHGYKWLPRAQKRKYSAARKKERLKFAKAVLRLTKAKLREKLSMAMDGVILSLPPRDATERANYCAHGDTHMWRLPGEAASEQLAGQDPYPYQIPADRVVPLWGGLSEGGFALVTFHHARKLTSAEWCREVRRGKLAKAIQSLSPVRPAGPWTVLCDNEAFLHTAASKRAMAAAGVRAWRDCEDLRRRRPPIGKMAFKVAVSRESADADIQRAFRKDTQRLNAARDAWSAAAAQGPGRGRPRAAAVPAAVAEPGSGLRVRCEAVLLTYQSWSPDVALPAWERFGVFVHANLSSWSVKHWTATMESNACGSHHLHLMLQFHKTQDCLTSRFIFESTRPNASSHDYLGEGVCKKKLQQSIDRGMFYVWANK